MIRSREEMLNILNNSNLAQFLPQMKQALLLGAATTILNATGGHAAPRTHEETDRFLLAQAGPAAAESAFEHALTHCRNQGHFRGVEMSLNGSLSHNIKCVHNTLGILKNDGDEVGDGLPAFSSVLRQFLLPRYAYLDFDTVVDPRHRIDAECGYPKFVTPIMYRYLYDRDDVASRVVDIYADEIWSADPRVYERQGEPDDPEKYTPFEQAWRDLCDDQGLLQTLYRIDKLAGVGHYGALLLGLDDGEDLEKPVDEPALLAGVRGGKVKASRERQLLYARPFDEYLSFVHQYETDVMHPRYGLPKFYNLVFLDMTIDAAGASIGTRLNRRVHWTRVVHVADNLLSSLVFGRPRMQPVFNRLLDLRKIKGACGEMFYKGAWPGVSFEVDPRFVADEVTFDEESFKKEVEDYANGLQRYLRTIGVSVKTLSPNIPTDPQKYVDLQVAAIAAHLNFPLRMFLGSEEGRLASSQDRLTLNQRLNRKINRFTKPKVLRNAIDRFVALGVMPPPSNPGGRYFTEWPDLNTPTDEDRANLSLKWTQAMSQYVASGMVHLIGPMDYLTIIVGLRPSQAVRIVDAMNAAGGLSTLTKVDPSQGSGVNGNREGVVKPGAKEGTSGGRPKERNSNDKKIEGSSS